MSCVAPYHVPKTNFLVPCGRCMQCRIAKQSSLTFLAERELLHDVYPKGLGASFVTLTYDEDSLPYVKGDVVERFSSVAFKRDSSKWTETLFKKDLQDFFKRCRRSMSYHNIDVPFRHISCGEYGDSTFRAHYHVVFLGLSDVLAQSVVARNWKFGFVDVGPLTSGGLRYVCKYITKKYDSVSATDLQVSLGVEPPFLIHSQRLGRNWIDDNIDSIVSNEFTFIGHNGKRQLLPKVVRDYVEKRTGVSSLPSIQKYLSADFKSCPSDKDYDTYCRERSVLREEYLVASARSNGYPVTPDFLARRKWIRPRSVRLDPRVVDFAKYDDIVPF